MIRETKGRPGRHQRHVAINAVASSLGDASGLVQAGGARVALQAFFIEERHRLLFGGLVRIVAGETRERAALQKATALAEVDGLVTNVPSIVPIDRDARGGRRAMAFAAKVIQFRRGEARWIR